MAIGVGELIVLGVLTAGGAAGYLLLTLLAPTGEHRRVAVLGLLLFGPALAFGLGAAVTPPDVITAVVWAVPLSLVCAAFLGLWLLARARGG
jgi:hypothetical protein